MAHRKADEACATEPWPLRPSEARLAYEDTVHAWRQRERDAKKQLTERQRASHGRGLDAAVAWELERMADEPDAPEPADEDPTKPRFRVHTVKEAGRRYAVVSLCVQNHAGDAFIVEARKRIDT